MRRRISLGEKLAVDHSDNHAQRLTLSTGYSDLARLLLETGRINDAKEALLRSLTVDRELSVQFADKIEPQLSAASTLHMLGLIDWQLGNPPEAEKASLETLSILRTLEERYPNNPEVREKLAGALDHIGTVYAQTGRLADAEPYLRDGLEHCQRLVEDFPRVPQHRLLMAGGHGNLATLLAQMKRNDEGDKLSATAVTIYEALVEEYPERSDFRQEFAFFLSNHAMHLLRSDKDEEAVKTCGRAIEMHEAIVRSSPDIHDNYGHLGKSLLSLGLIRETNGELVPACETYRRALTSLETALSKKPDHPFFLQLLTSNREYLARCSNQLAWRLAAHPEQEQRDGKASVAIATEACEMTEWKNWQYLDTLAAACAEVGDFENAIKWQETAIKEMPFLSILSKPQLQSRLEVYKTGIAFRDEELARE